MFEQRLHVHAQPAARHLAFGHRFFGDALREVAGNGAAEAEADFVDADDFTLQIHQRPAGVAAVNRRVMREPADQPADVFAIEAELAAGAPEPRNDHLGVAHDAERDRLRKRHRAAHRQHVIADAHFHRIAEAGRRELARLFRFQFDDRNVRQRIGADQFGLDLFAVRQRAEHPLAVAGDVMIGDDVTVLRDDRAAADLLQLDLAPFAVFDGDHPDAHQRGPHLFDGDVHLGAQLGRHVAARRRQARVRRKKSQGQDKKRWREGELLESDHARSCRAKPGSCKL